MTTIISSNQFRCKKPALIAAKMQLCKLLVSLILLQLLNWPTVATESIAEPPQLSPPNTDPFLHDSTSSENHRCVDLKIDFCNSVGYQRTTFPNLLGHQSQQEASQDINVYYPLLKFNCSADTTLFLCSVYAPMCISDVENVKSLQPCRSLCESVKSGCLDTMKKFGFSWPPQLECARFPELLHDKTCVHTNNSETYHPTNPPTGSHNVNGLSLDHMDRTVNGNTMNNNVRDLGFACPENFKTPSGYESHMIHLNGKSYKNCGIPCDGVILNKDDTQFLRKINGLLSIIALLSTSFTCLTFLLYTNRFQYPERPMIIISLCYLVVALCYLIGYFMGEELSCNEPFEPSKSITNIKMIRTVTRGIKKQSCTLLFMALYFFETATSLWWLMLTISWFMSAALRWVTEAIEGVSQIFHLISWSVSGLLTITVLALGEVDGDVMSGVCYVGIWNQDNLRLFVMLPRTICLSIGCLLLLSGFVSLWRTRTSLKQDGIQTIKLERLMLKIGAFSFLFIFPSVVQLYSYYYEQKNLNSWLLAWLSEICKSREYSIPCPKLTTQLIKPHYLTFIIKYFASMSIGIFSCFLVMTPKTMISYRQLFTGFCCQKNTQTHPLTSASHINHLASSSHHGHHHQQDDSGDRIEHTYSDPFVRVMEWTNKN